MRNLKLTVTMGIAASIAVVGGVAGVSGIAGADPATQSTTFVDGRHGLHDDFTDHVDELGGYLCEGCDNSNDTDLVVLWQSVLAVEGYLELDQIDGDFGAATTEATKRWQGEGHEFPATGEVEGEAWESVSHGLEWFDGENLTYSHSDSDGRIDMRRHDNDGGAYEFVGVVAASGEELVNTSGSDRIEMFKETITLEAK